MNPQKNDEQVIGTMTLRLTIGDQPYHGEYAILPMDKKKFIKALNSLRLHHHLSINDYLSTELTCENFAKTSA